MGLNHERTWLGLDEARAHLRDGSGRGVKIAVLDSGIEIAHPALRGMRLTDDVVVTSDGMRFSCLPGDGSDVFGHGTAVAGIIHELAPEAEIGSFRVLGTELDSRTALICEAAFEALDRGYHILNCSFGCHFKQHALQYKAWVDAAYLRGAHVIAASNNPESTRPEWPGHFSSVITVSTSATSSRVAGKDMLHYRAGSLVEFSAPGINLEVAWKDCSRKTVSGSSYATPHVTALLARLLSHSPDLTPTQAKALLQHLATPLGEAADHTPSIIAYG